MTTDGGIAVRGLRRSFGPVEALRGVDLEAPRGQVTALVGPNGAGKTTLLLILATLLAPDAGEVRVAGADPVRDPDTVRSRMGWAPDVFGLYDALTVREYLEFAAAAYRLPKPARRGRAAALITQAGLDPHADRPVHELSRGQKQRLGLARAMVHEPAVLLLDEPAAGLDPRARVQLRDLLRAVAAAGVAVLVSSHILADLEELADTAVIVDGGVTTAVHRLGGQATTRHWRLRSLDPHALLGGLSAAGVAASPPGPDGSIEVEVVGEAALASLVARLVEAGVPISGVIPVGGGLEAAFLAATGQVVR
jgi:ABC-2 type transport system ATP-binding protein